MEPSWEDEVSNKTENKQDVVILQGTESEIERVSHGLCRSGVDVLGGFLNLVMWTSPTAAVVVCRSYDVLLAKWKI